MAPRVRRPDDLVRKRIAFDAETWHALHQLSLDSMKSLQELAEEAFRDLLKKHRRPTTVAEMLRASVRASPANDAQARPGKRGRGRG
jgi:hypothetical protein